MLRISFLKSIKQSVNHSIIHPLRNLHYKFYITKAYNKMKATMPLLILIIQTLLFTTGCKQSTEPKLEALLKLELEDASCTEAWIKLSTANFQFPATINLLKDGNVAQTISLWRDTDTVLYVDSLLPSQTYRFKTIVQSSKQQINTSSNELMVTTMDTTSHEFTWQSWEFGTTGSSTLYDVAIINENDIWAVGEINIADTSINGYTTYNAVHWDGTKWELKKIQFYTFCGQQNTGSYPAKSVFAFGSNDVWIAMDGSQVVRWNGISQSQPICTPVSINKLWGSSSEDLYAVGNNGNIAHWDGSRWTKIESGTTLPIMDVYGARKDKIGDYEILCVSADANIPGQSKVISIEDKTVHELATDPMWEPWAIWFIPSRRYIHADDGLWEAYRPSGPWVRNRELPSLFKTSIDGQGLNDIVVCGAFMLLAHWNGAHWRTFFPRNASSGFVGVCIRDDLIVAVGGVGNRAMVLIGRR
ncbi:MAG: hypothetical protein AMXMBFR50_24900 [Ignavibacterium album]